jgi:integrase
VCWILPKLGNHEVASLTSAQLRQWVAWIVESEAPLTKEQLRRRRASANRHLSVLKAALTLAFTEGHVPSNAAWGKRVPKFKGVKSTRARYLTIEECRRFLAASDDTFRPLARAALETGMRYGELGDLVVTDFNKDAGTLIVRKSKTGKVRHVVLTPEGVKFFSDATAGRSPNELMFTKADGGRWTHGAQGIYYTQANQRGQIDPADVVRREVTVSFLNHSRVGVAQVLRHHHQRPLADIVRRRLTRVRAHPLQQRLIATPRSP